MKLISEKKNPLLHRKEVRVLVDAPSNPGMNASAEQIAAHFKTQKELVVIKKLDSSYGKSEFIVSAFIYDNAQALAIEPKPKAKKAVAQ